MGDNMGKTIMEEIEYAEDIKEFIVQNEDVEIDDSLKQKINNASQDQLLKIVKEIGSHPIRIKSVDVYDEEFLLKNF